VTALNNIGQQQGGDIGDGYQKVADVINTEAGKQAVLARSLQEEIALYIGRTEKGDRMEIDQFESDYKKVRGAVKAQIDKAEQQTKKAGKKGAAALQQSIQDLNDKIKEGENIKSDRLKHVVVIDRKKNCTLLGNFYTLMTHDNALHNEASAKIGSLLDPLKALAGAQATIPDKIQELVTDAQRTFVAVQADDNYNDSYSEDLNTYSPRLGASSSQSSPPPPPPFASYSSTTDHSYSNENSFGTVVALYSYDGQQDGDLPFYEGDYIELTAEDDGSGWMSGTCNGRSGVFPSSYVQYT